MRATTLLVLALVGTGLSALVAGKALQHDSRDLVPSTPAPQPHGPRGPALGPDAGGSADVATQDGIVPDRPPAGSGSRGPASGAASPSTPPPSDHEQGGPPPSDERDPPPPSPSPPPDSGLLAPLPPLPGVPAPPALPSLFKG